MANIFRAETFATVIASMLLLRHRRFIFCKFGSSCFYLSRMLVVVVFAGRNVKREFDTSWPEVFRSAAKVSSRLTDRIAKRR